jgi:hypothetical protein
MTDEPFLVEYACEAIKDLAQPRFGKEVLGDRDHLRKTEKKRDDERPRHGRARTG